MILSVFLLFFHLSIFAQQGNDVDSVQQTVSQDRRLLLDLFRAGRLDSVSSLVDSIESHHHEPPLLWPAERLLLYYWIERYHDIDSLARYFDSVSEEAAFNHPLEQAVWNVLSYHSSENIDTLVVWIDQSGCGDEVFDFRVRLLETLVDSEWDDQPSVERNIMSLIGGYTFQEEENSSEIQTVVPRQIETSQTYIEPWQIGFGMGIGPTAISGNISQYLSAQASLSFDFNVSYQRYYFSLLLQVIFAKLKRDIPVGNGGDVWESGSSSSIGNFGLAGGYSFINNRSLRMTPFVGLSISECAPSEQQIENNNALRNAGIRWGKSIICGVNTDVKLYWMERKDYLPSLNIKLNYIPAMFSNVSKKYSGNMFFITLGISMNVASSQ